MRRDTVLSCMLIFGLLALGLGTLASMEIGHPGEMTFPLGLGVTLVAGSYVGRPISVPPSRPDSWVERGLVVAARVAVVAVGAYVGLILLLLLSVSGS